MAILEVSEGGSGTDIFNFLDCMRRECICPTMGGNISKPCMQLTSATIDGTQRRKGVRSHVR